ncbi:DUF805 domain-containing protein [Agromyces sp. NPDC058110]|uniref:DUF805 domain-containing protein n=1 Tax=Agromyces sp. NPDC058110 TaxID=3346345 RepID=UPI0036DB4DD5
MTLTPPAQPLTHPRNDARLSSPLPGATLAEATIRFFTKYAVFSGRASRSEFWWWQLSYFAITFALYLILMFLAYAGSTTDPATGATVLGPGAIPAFLLYFGWSLAVVVPNLALFWRRLHDTGRPGWYFLFALIPFGGGLIVYIIAMLPSNAAGARFDR